jgi:hypothetical protein
MKLTAATAVKATNRLKYSDNSGNSSRNCGVSPDRTRNTISVAPSPNVVAIDDPSTIPVRTVRGRTDSLDSGWIGP